jgi:hypothetical protein
MLRTLLLLLCGASVVSAPLCMATASADKKADVASADDAEADDEDGEEEDEDILPNGVSGKD